MKIYAAEKINFGGLYTDKTKENNGNWRMEYRPYSWEKTEDGHYGQAPQTEWDVFASGLPNNEKKYVNGGEMYFDYSCYCTRGRGKEYCKDILGTEFYYHDFSNDTIRKTITTMPAMNREDSLRVYNSKLAKFVEIKEQQLDKLVDEEKPKLGSSENKVKDYDEIYDKHSKNVRKGIFDSKICDKDRSYDIMDEQFSGLKSEAVRILDSLKKTLTLNSTIKSIKTLIERNKSELSLLETLRNSGRLIDISRRDIYDPNKPLWDELQNLQNAAKKYVVLPDRTISIEEILRSLGSKIKKSEIPKAVIKYVDKLM